MQKKANRPGYKKTKVGWIPKDWDCVPFARLFEEVKVPVIHLNCGIRVGAPRDGEAFP
jgi:hypothetical protein